MTTETATKWTAEAATNKTATYVAWIIACRGGNAEQEAAAYAEACAAAAAYEAVSEAHASDIEVIVKAAEAVYNTAWDLAVLGAGSAFDAEAVEDAAWYLAVSGEGSTLFAAWEAVEAAREARDAHYAAYEAHAGRVGYRPSGSGLE